MKTTELMIGYWVTGKKWRENPFQITRINDSGRFIYGKTVNSTVGPFLLDELEPIPLIPEILEMNGFEYKDAWDEWWHRSEDGLGSDFQLSITDNGFSMKDIGNAKINFIHQLQHALRLCGLNELADNFKLEE